jgi:hypothetical protein
LCGILKLMVDGLCDKRKLQSIMSRLGEGPAPTTEDLDRLAGPGIFRMYTHVFTASSQSGSQLVQESKEQATFHITNIYIKA